MDPDAGPDPRILRGDGYGSDGGGSVLGSSLVTPNVGESPPRGSFGRVVKRVSKGAGAIPRLVHEGLEAKDSPSRGPRHGDGLVSHGEGSLLGSGPLAPKFG